MARVNALREAVDRSPSASPRRKSTIAGTTGRSRATPWRSRATPWRSRATPWRRAAPCPHQPPISWRCRRCGKGRPWPAGSSGRGELDRLLEIVEGILGAPRLSIEIAAANIGGVVIRVDLDRTIVVGERGFLVAEEALDERAVRIGLVEIRIELNGVVEILQGR